MDGNFDQKNVTKSTYTFKWDVSGAMAVPSMSCYYGCLVVGDKHFLLEHQKS